MMTGECTEGEQLADLAWGPHKSVIENAPFIHEEFASMVEKGQWMVIPYLVAKRLLGLRLIPPGVKMERDRRPRWLGNYSYYKTYSKTLPVSCLSAMQCGRALDRLLREMVFADPALGPIYILKANMSDGFYGIGVRPEDAPKLGLIFPSGADEEPPPSSYSWYVITPCLYSIRPRKLWRILQMKPSGPTSRAKLIN